MKMPEMVSKRKIRDANIVLAYARDKMTHAEIGKKFGLTQQRITQIITKNAHLLKVDKNYIKFRRLRHLEQMLEQYPDVLGSKSTLDILKEIREELEGNDKPQASEDQAMTKVIIIRDTNGNQNQDGTVSRPVSVVRV